MALVPYLIEKKDIFLANSLISVTATVAAIFGIGMGGVIVDSFGEATVLYIDAISFFVSALAIVFISVKEKEKFFAEDILRIGKDVVNNVKRSMVRELKEGIKYIFNSHETKYAFKIFLFLYSYIGGLFTVYIAYIQSVLKTGDGNVKAVGFTGIALALGIFLGSLIYGRIAHKFSVKKVINFVIFLASAFLIFFVISVKAYPYFVYAIFLSFVLGLIISPIFIGVNSLIHNESKINLMGRIFSSLEFISHLGFLIAMFISSLMANIFSPFSVIIIIGIIGFLFSLFFIFKND